MIRLLKFTQKKRKLTVKKNKKLKAFLDDELKEMEKYKWIKSEEARKDLGEICCLEWIKKYAKEFREDWENINGKVKDESSEG